LYRRNTDTLFLERGAYPMGSPHCVAGVAVNTQRVGRELQCLTFASFDSMLKRDHNGLGGHLRHVGVHRSGYGARCQATVVFVSAIDESFGDKAYAMCLRRRLQRTAGWTCQRKITVRLVGYAREQVGKGPILCRVVIKCPVGLQVTQRGAELGGNIGKLRNLNPLRILQSKLFLKHPTIPYYLEPKAELS
jgi:hypothetical protein